MLAIVAAAGPPRPQVLALSSSIASSAMVPINGRPVLGWILDGLLRRGVTDVAVLTQSGDDQLEHYVTRAYGGREPLKIACVPVETSGETEGLAHSVWRGLSVLRPAAGGSLLLVLGHTIYNGDLPLDDDAVVSHRVTEEVSRWCYVETNPGGYVERFVDKPDQYPLPASALIGVYHFTQPDLFRRCLDAVLARAETVHGRYEISSALALYGAERPIKAIEATTWLDCGSIAGIHRSRRALIASRAFNTVSVDEHLGVITKRSRDALKLYQERAWYLSLPDELKVLTPRVLDWKLPRDDDDRAELQLEYYGYNLLSEVWVYQNLHESVWQSIVAHLFEITRRFRRYKATLTAGHFHSMYWDKTVQRVQELLDDAPDDTHWRALLGADEVTINSVRMRGYQSLSALIRSRIPKLYTERHATIIHGDLHLGNILYDVNSRLLKLIDARGNFGTGGIFGDCKYDLAKLRHSLSGGYDLIVNDLFAVSVNGTELTLTLSTPAHQRSIVELFDRLIVEDGFAISEIKLIEGLLFLSMLPLHVDAPGRQLAMFVQGVTILNEVFDV